MILYKFHENYADADKIAHQVYQPNSPVLQEIASEFGSAVLTEDKSEINRKELGKIVFADSNAMKKLEQIVWPHAKNLIRSEITQLSTNTTSTPSIIVLEAAILLDAQWDDLCDAVWIITAPYDIALQRLIEKRSMKQEDAQKKNGRTRR
uniref:Dephospho-CoA kinase n=1 Tax=Ditylum brightwellii TaxID=49249 RepID=A0A7S4REM7_9STRA